MTLPVVVNMPLADVGRIPPAQLIVAAEVNASVQPLAPLNVPRQRKPSSTMSESGAVRVIVVFAVIALFCRCTS